jgi:hypothetical protein
VAKGLTRENSLKEEKMAREWKIEEEMDAMDGMLVEIFGCTSFGTGAAKTGKAPKGTYRDYFVPVHAMEDMLVEIFGCTAVNGKGVRTGRKTKVDFSRYVAAMDDRLVEIFGCTAVNGKGVRTGRKTKVDFSRYVAAMDDRLVEIFGCTPLDHKVIPFDVILDRRSKKGLSAGLPTVDAEALQVTAALKMA